ARRYRQSPPHAFWKNPSSAAPAFHARRQNLELDPVRHFADAQLLLEHILADAVPPGQPLAARIAVECVEILRKGFNVRLVREKAFLDQAPADAPDDGRNLAQRIFRMILHSPRG